MLKSTKNHLLGVGISGVFEDLDSVAVRLHDYLAEVPEGLIEADALVKQLEATLAAVSLGKAHCEQAQAAADAVSL